MNPTHASGGAHLIARGPRDPKAARVLRLDRLLREAGAWNRSHNDLVLAFNRLTLGACATEGGGVSAREVYSWQRANGVQADGKVGPETVDAARRVLDISSKKKAAAPTRSQPSIPASMGPEPAGGRAGLADSIVAGGVTLGQESREKRDPEEAIEEGGKRVGEGVEYAGEGVDAIEHLGKEKSVERALEASKAGDRADLAQSPGLGHVVLKSAAEIARLPHVIHLIKHERYREAVSYIRDGLGYGDYVEVIKLVAKQAGLDLATLLPRITKAVTIGAETADVVLVGIEFQMEALKALADAHASGDRDNRIYLYSTAWASGFLWGAYSNPGAITDEQQEAVAGGLRDGKATAGGCGERAAEIGKALLRRYGDPKNIERALVDALLRRAGIEGIKLHEGRR